MLLLSTLEDRGSRMAKKGSAFQNFSLHCGLRHRCCSRRSVRHLVPVPICSTEAARRLCLHLHLAMLPFASVRRGRAVCPSASVEEPALWCCLTTKKRMCSCSCSSTYDKSRATTAPRRIHAMVDPATTRVRDSIGAPSACLRVEIT